MVPNIYMYKTKFCISMICHLYNVVSFYGTGVQVFRGPVEEVVYCSVRRCLCYALYRHWQLVQRVLQDTGQLFLLGIHIPSGVIQ